MISPMPFCPSFEPWKKLTPVQVSTNRLRIQNGGGSVPFGASYSRLSLMSAFMTMNSNDASANPKIGDSSNDFPIFSACAQSTPLVPLFGLISWFAIPTPMIDPIKLCELDAGIPSHQVPRFHRIAAISSANTIANPADPPTCKINSTGNSDTMPNATAPVDGTTPRKFQKPDHTTARFGSSECV